MGISLIVIGLLFVSVGLYMTRPSEYERLSKQMTYITEGTDNTAVGKYELGNENLLLGCTPDSPDGIRVGNVLMSGCDQKKQR